ncbi:hypothetical protein ACFXCZ_27265 [Streptomyces sp. NPDC059396]|uniref:hypothetical protein n=1 Tax=Streptomyces sp. NPDC059396 TaxID=3346819 RepID=UPI0036A3EDEF
MAQYLDHPRIAQKLLDQQGQINDLTAAVARAEEERDGAYRERAHLVAWLASAYESLRVPAPDTDEPGWQIIYLYAGPWQMSWHIAPRDADLVKDIPTGIDGDPRAQWDGHTTDQKYRRIRNHTRIGWITRFLGVQRKAKASASVRGFHLHQRGRSSLPGALFPSGYCIVLDDALYGFGSAAATIEHLLLNYPDASLEWAGDRMQAGTTNDQPKEH